MPYICTPLCQFLYSNYNRPSSPTNSTNERRTGPSRFSFSLYDHMPAECTSSAKLCLYVTRFVNSVYCRFCAPLSIHVWCSGALPMHTDEKYLKNGTFILAKKFYGVNFLFLILTMSMSFGKQKQYAFYFNEFCSVIQGFLKKKYSAV